MRAFIYKTDSGLAKWITGEYKTEVNLIRFGVRPFLKPGESVDVHLFWNWDNRYRENPDKLIRVTI